MTTSRRGVRLLNPNQEAVQGFTTAVSLHCHTDQSRESLDFVPHYASKIPLVSKFLVRELEQYAARNGEVIDFARAFWIPPLPPRAVLDSEVEQIERAMGLKALVSITDHDDIGASTQLKVLHQERDIPVSLEWTVPFGPGFFHIGVHNLPPEESTLIWAELMTYTRNPAEGRLAELFELLCGHDATLLVLNHPLWDIERIGQARHCDLLTDFLSAHGHRIHAIEVNGYRSWSENQQAIELAEMHGLPIISGGDRHGRQSNAVLNLTNAATFSQFADEMRSNRVSQIAILPAYQEPLALRMLETVADVLKYYPAYAKGRRHWTDRIFWTLEDGSVRPMSSYWGKRGPGWVRASLSMMKLIGSRPARTAMRLVFARDEGVQP